MSNFIGDYVEQLIGVCIASAVSGENVMILGAPGWGKTRITLALADHLASQLFTFNRIAPSTPPDRVTGAWNPKLLIEEGRFERVVTNTPYDPATKYALLDEAGRGNDAMFDTLLDVTDRLDVDDPPPVWATSNFFPKTSRNEALIDRFAIWFWVPVGDVDTDSVVVGSLSKGGPTIDLSLIPNEKDIHSARTAVAGPKAIKAIQQTIRDLKQEATSPQSDASGNPVPPYSLHPRRIHQWATILFRLGVLYSGLDPNFETLPPQAIEILKYCWPCVTPDEAARWSATASAVVDVVGAAIESAKNQVYEHMMKIDAEKDASSRLALASQAGGVIQNSITTLIHLVGKDDPRVNETRIMAQGWLAEVLSGQGIIR